jgi:hypothetical protein
MLDPRVHALANIAVIARKSCLQPINQNFPQENDGAVNFLRASVIPLVQDSGE